MKEIGIILLLILSLLKSGSLHAEPEKEFTRDEVSQHNAKSDCWIIVENKVYDITSAMKDHLRYKYELDSWCGKEATEAWTSKDGKNKAHSRKAQLMLNKLLKGKIQGS